MSEILSRVSTGVVDRPISVLIHGPAGCGKSTFAAGAPDPLFIDCDNRSAHLDVKRIKPDSWEDVIGIFRHVAKGELVCKTLVVDTLDHAELLLHAHLATLHNVATVEDIGGGWQKGYVAALSEWRRFSVASDAVRQRGVNLVMLAHSADRKRKNATGEDYATVDIALDTRATKFLSQRVDGIGYANFDTLIVKSEKGPARAKTTGKVTLSFAPSAAITTKRFAKFPESCALTWEAFTSTKENK